MTNTDKNKIIKLILELKPMVIIHLNKFSPDEQNYIYDLIVNQTRLQGFEIELNGTSENPMSHTKFRKLILPKTK